MTCKHLVPSSKTSADCVVEHIVILTNFEKANDTPFLAKFEIQFSSNFQILIFMELPMTKIFKFSISCTLGLKTTKSPP